jgi:hypothetical protein
VTVIGWSYLVLSVLRFAQGLMGWVIWKVGGLSTLLPQLAKLLGFGLPPEALIKHFDALVVVHSLVSALVAFVAYSLLRVRPWARAGMEIVCWSLLVFLAGMILVLMMWSQRNAAVVPPRIAGPVALDMAIIGAYPGLTIWFLRRPNVRQAFKHPGQVRPV